MSYWLRWQGPVIMGILNVTPDSFSDGGRYQSVSAALAKAQAMVEEGADIIDIGGESTRPGSDPTPADEQIRRTAPVIRALREHLPAHIELSIDTTSAQVAAAALDAGARIINDVSAGTDDPELMPLAAARQSPLVLMHRQGTPKTMQQAPYYQDVVTEVCAHLKAQAQQAQQQGVRTANIALDPGIGFGKRKIDNLTLMAQLAELTQLGFPVLLGSSRKRFMGSVLTVDRPEQLVTATAVTTALGVMAGVKIFRVHDVKANRQAADLSWAIQQHHQTANTPESAGL
ncbi:MAG: dihydropteroate synthase [Methylococcales bacterium]|nr:dihydropteroate synthase [Methylococcales bacterium]